MTHAPLSDHHGLPVGDPAGPSGVTRRDLLRGGLLVGTGLALGGLELRLAGGAQAIDAPPIISTVEWGAAPPRSAISVLDRRPSMIVVHHTASANSTDYSVEHARQLARNIQQWHFGNGWIDSGQQFTISRGGHILEGRHRSLEVLRGGSRHVLGAHAYGQNARSLGIENEGTYSAETPPAAQYQQLVTLCAYMCQQYGIDAGAIHGHRDFVSTSCPGDQLYAMLPQLRADVAALLRGGPVPPPPPPPPPGPPPPPAPGRSWPLVGYGEHSERVATVQYLLRERAYWRVAADGIFGPVTDGAVRNFQSVRGLAADGIVGPITWEHLAGTVLNGSNGNAVRGVQSQLRTRGHNLAVDGIFGPVTEGAVRSFQAGHQLDVDGIVGPFTWSRLVS